MDLMRIGKKILFILMAITAGLTVGLKFLQAHSPQNSDTAVLNSDPQSPRIHWNTFLQRVNLISSDDNPVLVPASLPEVQQYISKSQRSGVALATISYNQVYRVDKNGWITSQSGSLDVLPVITASELYFDLKSRAFAGADLELALQFLQMIKETDAALYYQISEIHIDSRVGLVLFCSAGLVPVIIGRNNIYRKAMVIHSLWRQLGSTELLSEAKYLDTRYKGQIVLKKAL